MIGLKYLPAFAVFAAGAAVALAAPAAHAEGFVQSFMADIGLAPPNQAPIDYRERAPLVIPKTLDQLPPPESGKAATAGVAWPKDPDQTRISAEQAEKNLPETERWRYVATHTGQYPISPDELRRNRVAAEAITHPVDEDNMADAGYEFHRLTPEQLRKGARKPVSTAFVREPRRVTLTDPPPGYRTPAADAPYAGGKDIVHQKIETYREAADRALENAGPR